MTDSPKTEKTQRPTRFISAVRGDEEAVRFLNGLIERAAREGASDIHFEDEDGGYTTVRFRFSGELEVVERIPRELMTMCDSKIRARCKMSSSERNIPLDGRTFVDVDGVMIDLRVSIAPITNGQSIVMRLIDSRNARRTIASVEMPDCVREELMKVLDEPNGLVVMTGPTGSGKTSTLYAMLNHLNTTNRKILTVEDPVEYRLPGVNQCEVNDKMNFAAALRSFLRQDPDVILVGEIRDGETAQTAIHAALTGHLVFTTLHTNDAPTTLTRLTDLGVDAFSLGAVLRAAISQRLSRKLAPCCKRPADLNAAERAWLAEFFPSYAETQFYTSDGCPECGGKGTSGRVPVIEMAVGTHEVQVAILKNSRPELLTAVREQHQYESLIEAGLRLAAAGQISLAEARKLASNVDPAGKMAARLPNGRASSDSALLGEST